MRKNKNALLKLIGVALCIYIVLLASSTMSTASSSPENLLQYEWINLGHDEGHTRFSSGPAPNKPEVLWSTAGTAYAAFSGKVFVVSGGGFPMPGFPPPPPPKLKALDPNTGQEIWSVDAPDIGWSTGIYKITNEYLLVDTNNGIACHRVSDGARMWSVDIQSGSILFEQPGTASYFPGRYSEELKMKYRVVHDTATLKNYVVAYNVSNPLVPATLAWKYECHEPSQLLCVGGGKVFVGSFEGAVYALDGKTGQLLWKSRKIGQTNTYSATYYNGKLYQGAGTTRLTCYNASTGEIIWEFDAGPRSFFVYGFAAAYGRIYAHNIDPWGGYVGCWDAETGELLWKTPAYYYIGYLVPAIADGKLYIGISDGMPVAGATEAPPVKFACIDAFTGEVLWELPGVMFSSPIIAYGKLYGSSGWPFTPTTYCISETPPKDWPYWRGNMEKPGVATNQMGPVKLNLIWKYQTGGAVTSSPAIVNGKVYIGSYDKNLYCLDAYTGNLLWKFETGFRIASSPAVAGNRVYLGPDDGYVYCLDANTGAQIWKKAVGGFYPSMMVEVASWQVRSSPIIVNNRLYVGGLDGKVYCLNALNGEILWNYTTGMPIVGSPAYYSGRIYITSLDRNVYCLDANTGAKLWNWTTPKVVYGWTYLFMVSTPTVINGVVYVGAGGHSLFPTIGPVYMAALNATTGAEIWCVVTYPTVGFSGDNSNQPFAPTVVGDIIYHPCYMGVAARSAKNGSLIWHKWLGFQVFSSVLYVDDPFGPKLYVGSDSYSITCLDAKNGETLSVYTTGAQVVSSPAVYDGMIYVGSCDGCIYCLGNVPTYCPTIVAWCDWKEAYVGENIIVHSRLLPGLPGEKLILTLTKPDGTQVHVNATTDQKGWVHFSFTVDTTGPWTWTVWYEGRDKGYIRYAYSYTDTHSLTVKSAITQQQAAAGPAIPTEYIVAIILAAIIIIAIAIYIIKRRR